MVRIVLRSIGTTFLTVAILGAIVLTRTDRGSAQGPTVVTLGDLPEPLPGLGPEVGGAPSPGGLPAVVGALRAYLGGTAPEPASEEPEGVRVNLGRPSGAGEVRVNRGLP